MIAQSLFRLDLRQDSRGTQIKSVALIINVSLG